MQKVTEEDTQSPALASTCAHKRAHTCSYSSVCTYPPTHNIPYTQKWRNYLNKHFSKADKEKFNKHRTLVAIMDIKMKIPKKYCFLTTKMVRVSNWLTVRAAELEEGPLTFPGPM